MIMDTHPKIRFAFFGSSRLSVIVLDELSRHGFIPVCVVTTPDKPVGRKLAMAPNAVKQWAVSKGIKTYDPAKLDAAVAEYLHKESCDIFVVASYGKIIPESILDIPPQKTLNIHPSLLPKYRGPSPLPSAMLDDAKHTGVTIMRLDKEMDHGPIVAQRKVDVDEWPIYEEFEEEMAVAGASLLAEILPQWAAGKIEEKEQDHFAATYTRKISKEDGLLDQTADAYVNFRKIQAFHGWPQAYFFIDHKGRRLRVKVTGASFAEGRLKISKMIPEGGKEMPYEDFRRGYLSGLDLGF
jgi:methionyl-tRNA formyltransferase